MFVPRVLKKGMGRIFKGHLQGIDPCNDILSIVDGFVSKYMNFQVVWIKNSNLISFLNLY